MLVIYASATSPHRDSNSDRCPG